MRVDSRLPKLPPLRTVWFRFGCALSVGALLLYAFLFLSLLFFLMFITPYVGLVIPKQRLERQCLSDQCCSVEGMIYARTGGPTIIVGPIRNTVVCVPFMIYDIYLREENQ